MLKFTESLKDREYFSSRNEFSNEEFYDTKKLNNDCVVNSTKYTIDQSYCNIHF